MTDDAEAAAKSIAEALMRQDPETADEIAARLLALLERYGDGFADAVNAQLLTLARERGVKQALQLVHETLKGDR